MNGWFRADVLGRGERAAGDERSELSHVTDREAERITLAVATHQLDDIDTLSQTLQSAANRSEPPQRGTTSEAARRTDLGKSAERDL